MCEAYYVEALEHSAHLVTVEHQKSVVEEIRIQERHRHKLDIRREKRTIYRRGKSGGKADGG